MKGSDWGPNEIVGRDEVEGAGGKVVSIPLEPGHSTTNLSNESDACPHDPPAGSRAVSRVGHLPAVEAVARSFAARARRNRRMRDSPSGEGAGGRDLAAWLVRPIILLVESNQRAEELFEPMRYFFEALTGKPRSRVAMLPAHDVLPYENRSPHAELSEERAVCAVGLTSGEIGYPPRACLCGVAAHARAEFYAALAVELTRDRDFPQARLIEHLASVGYEQQETVEIAGAIRGARRDRGRLFSGKRRAGATGIFRRYRSNRCANSTRIRSVRCGLVEHVTLLPLDRLSSPQRIAREAARSGCHRPRG